MQLVGETPEVATRKYHIELVATYTKHISRLSTGVAEYCTLHTSWQRSEYIADSLYHPKHEDTNTQTIPLYNRHVHEQTCGVSGWSCCCNARYHGALVHRVCTKNAV